MSLNTSHFIPSFSVLPLKNSDTADLTFALTRALQGATANAATLRAIQNLSATRLQILSSAPSEQLRDMIWNYIKIVKKNFVLQYLLQCHLRGLILLQKTDGLPTKLTYNTLDFEYACMLYNLGCCIHAIAGGQTQSSRPDSLKAASHMFQQAADVFQKAADHASMCTSVTGDVSPARLKTLSTYSLGCAHLVMHLNAVIQNKSVQLQLKLASAAYNQLKSSVTALHKMYGLLSTSEVLGGPQCIFCYSSYRLHILASDVSLENLEHGERIKHLKIAMKAADLGVSLSKKSSQKTSFKQLHSNAKTLYNTAIKDNDKIYMKSVPKSKDLPAIPEIIAAKPIPFEE
ncbi:programmed cell death 6-interacting protein isoform X1 [Entamoeba marina]